MKLPYIGFPVVLALSFIPIHCRASSTDTIQPTSSQPTPRVNRLPEDKMYVTSRERELERLLKNWFEGYTLFGTNQNRDYSAPEFLVPNTPDSVYIKMLNALPSAIRMSYNPIVRETIELYLYKRRNMLSSMLSLADLYFPEIETALDKKGLPIELKYLTIVESALNPSAVSPAGAAGLWQFMLPTGKIYGLTVNSLLDERLDPKRSTEAACQLLLDLYKIYNDWWLTIAAYNCGPGSVNRALARVGGEKSNFWDIYSYLPKETRRYIPLFIGAYFSMYYHRNYGIQPRKVGRSVACDYYTVREALSFSKIAEITGLNEDEIALYNPQYRRHIVPGNTSECTVRLPISAILKLEANDSIAKSPELNVSLEGPQGTTSESNNSSTKGHNSKAKNKTIYHKVRKGETLASIARKYGVSVQELKRHNHIRGSKLKTGASLIIKN